MDVALVQHGWLPVFSVQETLALPLLIWFIVYLFKNFCLYKAREKLQLYKVSSCQETKPVPCKMYLYFTMIGFYAGKTLESSLLLKSGEFKRLF